MTHERFTDLAPFWPVFRVDSRGEFTNDRDVVKAGFREKPVIGFDPPEGRTTSLVPRMAGLEGPTFTGSGLGIYLDKHPQEFG